MIHAIFHEQGHPTLHWHFQLVDTLYFYIPEETSARPRIQYACFEEYTEYEIEQAAVGLELPRQGRPYGGIDPCFEELAGGWHVKDRLGELWDDFMRNAILAPNGDAAMALTFTLV